jgi:hypothetical protein
MRLATAELHVADVPATMEAAMRTRAWILLTVVTAISTADCADDGPPLTGGPATSGSGGVVDYATGGAAAPNAGSGGTRAGTGGTRAGSGGTFVECGPCDVPIRIEVRGSNGRPTHDWSARIRGNGFDCTTKADPARCVYGLTPGAYRVDVESHCTSWSKRVRVQASTPPGPNVICSCGYFTEYLELREPDHCDATEPGDDAGAEDAGSEDAGR